MPGSDRGKEFELRVTDIEDPLPDATFGSIGRYAEVALPDKRKEPFVPQRITLRFDAEQAAHVDLYTLTLFRVDLESRTFTPVESSRVDVDRRVVTAWVNEPGTYGLIGLPKHAGILETLRLFDRFGTQLLEEQERGEHGLHDRICGLILCADPILWGDGPTGPGNLCQKCLGLDVSWGRLPERYLLERRVHIPPFRAAVDDDEPAGGPSLLGWGWNKWAELGDGSKTRRNTPVWVAPILNVKKIVGGGSADSFNWTLALDTDGSVWSWGNNVSGQLGILTFVNERSTPGRVAFLTDVVDIAAGSTHGVAVRADGSVWKWGWEDLFFASAPARLPVRVLGLTDIVAVAAGASFTLALRNDGRVFAWGAGSLGQLGDGSTVTFRANPVQVPGLTAVRSIAAGLASAFATKANGSVVAWGLAGSIGVAGTANSPTPVPVPGLNNIEQISAHIGGLARTSAGDVWFWGTNSYGESGDGTTTGVYVTPVQVPGLHQITGIAVAGWHCLALRSDGTVWGWGNNQVGEVGVGPAPYTQNTPIVVPLPGGRLASGVGAGERSSFAIVS
jgi:alpha-tubulin suppressor-like RCC1 family protein